MSMDERLREVKAEIRSLIVSSPVGLTIKKLILDYRRSLGKPLPYKEFGYDTAIDFLSSLHDVVYMYHNAYDTLLIPVRNEQSAHINELVQNQKRQKFQNYIGFPLLKPSMLPPSPSFSLVQEMKTDLNTTEDMTKVDEENLIVQEVKVNVLDNVMPLNTTVEDTAPRTTSGSGLDKVDDCKVEEEDPIDIPDAAATTCSLVLSDPAIMSVMTSSNGSICNENISDQMKENFREILQEHPKGITCSKLGSMYKEKFGCPLVVEDLGFSSFRELVIALPNVFSFEKGQHSNDWLLFDARINPKRKVSKNSPWIPNHVLDNIAKLATKYPLGLFSDEFLELYMAEHEVKIDVKKLGFENTVSFLVNCTGLQLKIFDEGCYVFPKSVANKQNEESMSSPETSIKTDDAVPPPNQIDYIWSPLFTDEVCDRTSTFKDIVLPNTSQIRVNVSDVHSPDTIWLQPTEFSQNISDLMYNLNNFYDDFEEKYIIDEKLIKPGQVCCVRFSLDKRWYRGKILDVHNVDTNIKVSYVDYGTVNYERKEDLRLLHRDFIDAPIFVIRAKLHNLKPVDETWPRGIVDYLFELLYQKLFFANIIDYNPEVPIISVTLIDTTNNMDRNINDLLIQNNMAACAAILEVPGVGQGNEPEVNGADSKNILSKEVSPEFLEIIKNLLPTWLAGTCEDDEETGIHGVINEIQKCLDEIIRPTELPRCCTSHLIRTMFLTDPESISKVWQNIVLKNLTFLYQEFLKEVTNIAPLDEKFFYMQPLCQKYSCDTLENTLLKTQKERMGTSKEHVVKEHGEEQGWTYVQTERESERPTLGLKLSPQNSPDLVDQYRSLTSTPDLFPKCFPTFHENRGEQDRTSPYSSPSSPSNCSNDVIIKSGGMRPLSYLNSDVKFIYETELWEGKKLIVLSLVNYLYVVQEQIIRDFTDRIPSMLLKHRTNRFVDQSKNILVTSTTHPGIYRTLNGIGLINDSVATLMPLENVSNFLKIVSPQDKFGPKMFEIYAKNLSTSTLPT